MKVHKFLIRFKKKFRKGDYPNCRDIEVLCDGKVVKGIRNFSIECEPGMPPILNVSMFVKLDVDSPLVLGNVEVEP